MMWWRISNERISNTENRSGGAVSRRAPIAVLNGRGAIRGRKRATLPELRCPGSPVGGEVGSAGRERDAERAGVLPFAARRLRNICFRRSLGRNATSFVQLRCGRVIDELSGGPAGTDAGHHPGESEFLMLYYPQLSSGVLAQYPIAKQISYRTVINTLPDGRTITMADLNGAFVTWQLTYSGLSDAEWSAIEQLFTQVQGSYGTFTFADPAGNLLAWSEDPTQAVWEKDPLITVAGGFADSLGGTGAAQITNSAQAAQGLRQNIAAASAYQYCFSVYLRGDTPVSLQMVVSSASGQVTQTASVGTEWSRLTLSGNLGGSDSSVSFGVELPPGVRVYAFGFQPEAQPSAGLYRPTTDQGGVYSNSRFATDELRRVATGPNQNGAQVTILSTIES